MIQETEIWTRVLLSEHPYITLTGKCHDCGKPVSVDVSVTGTDPDGPDGWESTGLYWKFVDRDAPYFKCNDCASINPNLTNYQPCEVFSRVCGYVRPTAYWNKGKQAEWDMRKNYKVNEAELKSEVL